MKKYTSIIMVLIAILLAWSCERGVEGPPPPAPPESPNPLLTSAVQSDIYKMGTEGYSCFRIPAIVKTKKGTLLAFAEARKTNCNDNGNIDLVVKRSTDNGATWGPLTMIWDDGNNTCGNPVPVVDQSTGNIFLVMSWNRGQDAIGDINNGTGLPRRAYVTSSDDDGLSWAEPTNISAQVLQPGWGWLSTGPCHGIQLTKGAHKDRLVIPACFITVNTNAAARVEAAFAMYSDDHGKSWHSGAYADPNGLTPSETTMTELPDGRILMNSRCTGKNYRISSISSDGGGTWTKMLAEFPLIDPVNQGSLLGIEFDGVYTVFFSNAASTKRANMAITVSDNEGGNWTRRYIVNPDQVAYSDLVLVGTKNLGITYETGIANPYEKITFESFPLDSLKK